ncbi:hypothetical protein QCN27_01950 [Cereibacter sp. SYSU M97828]|nr:hypothetical protein [Cereibacter flavus]
MIRHEIREGLHRWREVIAAGLIAVFGLWLIGKGWFLGPIGALLLALGAALALNGWRRLRFAGSGDGLGVVSVDEGQVSYLAPEVGGFIALSELVELRLLSVQGRRMWRLRQSDGQALLIPVDAAGADKLFDAFASLPGMDVSRLLAANPDMVVWTRHLRVLT